MRIKKEIGTDLLACMEQVNDWYKRDILVFNEKQPYNGFVVVVDDDGFYYLTTSFHNPHIVSKRINKFLERFYILLAQAKIVRYPTRMLADGLIVRFDGFNFITYDKDLSPIDSVGFSEFDEKIRKEYFECITIK